MTKKNQKLEMENEDRRAEALLQDLGGREEGENSLPMEEFISQIFGVALNPKEDSARYALYKERAHACLRRLRARGFLVWIGDKGGVYVPITEKELRQRKQAYTRMARSARKWIVRIDAKLSQMGVD